MKTCVFQITARNGNVTEFRTEDAGYDSWLPAIQETNRLRGAVQMHPGQPSHNPVFLRFEEQESCTGYENRCECEACCNEFEARMESYYERQFA